MGWLSKVAGWKVKGDDGRDNNGSSVKTKVAVVQRTAVQRDIDLGRQLNSAHLRPHTQQKVTEIAYKEKELRTLLKGTYEAGSMLLENLEIFQQLFGRQITASSAPLWKEKLGKEIISPAVRYWESIERLSQLAERSIEGSPRQDVIKMQAYRQTLAAVADKDFKDSGSQFIGVLQKSLKSRQNQIIRLLALKIDSALEPPYQRY